MSANAVLTLDEKREVARALRAKARLRLLPFILYTKPDYKAGWFHYILCEKLDQFLQDVMDEKSPRMMIMAPPRHGKSEAVSRRFPAFAFGRYPDLSFIATSYSNDLASTMNRDVQKVIDSEEYAQLFPGTRLSGSAVRTVTAKGSYLRNSDNFEIVDHKGIYKSAGVGTGVTGRGARILVIDDPVKDAEEAYSPTTRKSVWNWYESTLKTRAEPGGGILLIMCMVGSTPVLMADGTEKPMLEIRPGDEIATYKDGAVSTSFVKHWKCQGSDLCYEIRTISGRIVKANERHPFLVRRNGELEWVRLRDLKVGDKLVAISAHSMDAQNPPMPEGGATGMKTESECTQSAIMGSGAVSHAQSKSVESLLAAKDSARLTTINNDGPVACALRPLEQSRAERHGFATGMGSNLSSTTPYSRNREESAPFAGLRQRQESTCQPTGLTSSALTTIHAPAKSEDSCATTAISLLEDKALQKFSNAPLSIYEITDDEVVSITETGYEDVFDIEVAETENFIANGLVSHNTRWHSDDLAGRLLTAMENGGEQWEIVRFPAIAEEDEEYRLKGEALHPERYPITALNRIRFGSGQNAQNAGTGSRVWASLYQQRPSVAEGAIFRRDKWQFYKLPPTGLMMEVYDDVSRLKTFLQLTDTIQYWDTAAGGKQSNDYSACVTLGIAKNKYYMLDFFMQKIEFPELERAVQTCFNKWKPSRVGVEGGGSASGKTVIQTLSRTTRIPFYEVVHSKDKVLRANVVSPIQEAGLVELPENTAWVHDFIDSCATFPNAANDDCPDAFMGAIELAQMKRQPMRINEDALAAI